MCRFAKMCTSIALKFHCAYLCRARKAGYQRLAFCQHSALSVTQFVLIPRRIVCPTIQDIHRTTWEDVGASGYKMMFQWNFEFSWYDDYADEVPIAAGGVLAITRRWFVAK